jgi:hypothetical protein
MDWDLGWYCHNGEKLILRIPDDPEGIEKFLSIIDHIETHLAADDPTEVLKWVAYLISILTGKPLGETRRFSMREINELLRIIGVESEKLTVAYHRGSM